MTGGYSALAEKLFISYLCDLLRPHSLRRISLGLHRHVVAGKYTYYHPRNRFERIEAERFFRPHNKDFLMWCDMLGVLPNDVLKLVEFCVKNNKDRLYGKHAMRAFFKSAAEQDNGGPDGEN
ncbi:MAG: hypothetical protein IJU89_00660 [Alphaproteobacteria bacterium]|nr:hypothetical protein [Alphaproteobacteria bacterium]